MSDTALTHPDLVDKAGRWLASRCSVVITEMATSGEEPDAIGWNGNKSILVECKASREDFKHDGFKIFRARPELGIGCQRYYLAPSGLIKSDEVPDGWGLLEPAGSGLSVVRESRWWSENNARHEMTILLSAMRRIGHTPPKGVSVRCYTIETKNRAGLGLEPMPEAGEGK